MGGTVDFIPSAVETTTTTASTTEEGPHEQDNSIAVGGTEMKCDGVIDVDGDPVWLFWAVGSLFRETMKRRLNQKPQPGHSKQRHHDSSIFVARQWLLSVLLLRIAMECRHSLDRCCRKILHRGHISSIFCCLHHFGKNAIRAPLQMARISSNLAYCSVF